ncbi:MAG TPA: phosphoribosylformylglycinamidine synthase subunit PurS [Candidatus Thermoplasmatota archaeon]|nr:phosphoribosylformylglycinamidine synthase subunit PurS [Candidatus Thermoplasmatota archaeon]
MFRAEVRVELRPGVTDPEGANTKKTLELLGFGGVKAVKSVKSFTVDLEAANESAAREQVEEMARRLLSNPVIHTTKITLSKA